MSVSGFAAHVLRRLRHDPIARASLLAVTSRFTNVLVSLVTGIVVARTLGPAGKGALAYLATATNLIARLVSFGLEAAFTRFHHVKHVPADVAAGSVVWTVVALGAAGALGTNVLLSAVPAVAAAVPELLARAYSWAMPAVMFMFVLGPIMYGLRAEASFGLLELAMRLVMLCATVGVVGTAWNNLLTVGLLQLLALVAAAVAGFVLLRRRLGQSLPWHAATASAMLVAAPGVYGYNTIRYGLGYGSLLLAAQLLDVSDAGLFSVASMLSESVTLLATSVNMAFYPAVSSVADPGRFARRVTAVVMALCAGFGLLLVVLGRWLIPVVYGEEFAPAVPVFAALLPGVVMLGGEQVLGSLFVAAGRTILAIAGVLIGALLLPLFSLVLADRGGLFGLAVASSLAHSIAGALAMVMYLRHHRTFALSLRHAASEGVLPGNAAAPMVSRR